MLIVFARENKKRKIRFVNLKIIKLIKRYRISVLTLFNKEILRKRKLNKFFKLVC